MITDERIAAYINSLTGGNTPFLDELEKWSHEHDIPIIRRETQNLLRTMIALSQPKNILEVGTAVGFSTILMAQYSNTDTHITTIEKYEKRIPIAKDNFAKSGFEDRITFLTQDATDALRELADAGKTYDMIFMDAAKGQYINFLPDVRRLLAPGALLISDNVLQDGDIIQSRFAVERRNRTIHARMREYLYVLSNDPEFATSVLPIGDGMTISVKR